MVDTVHTYYRPAASGSIAMPLFIVFLILKLTDVVDWPWWWVTAPLWIPLAFVMAIVLVGSFGAGVVALARRRK